MRTHLAKLKVIHEDLFAAIDAGEAARASELAERRGRLLEELDAAFAAASAEERAILQPELRALLSVDRDLQGRAAALLEQLRAQLDGQRGGRSHHTTASTITGVLDRQA